MASRDSERDRRVRELLSKKKDDFAVLGQSQAEIQDIQSDLQNHLAMQQAQDANRLQQTQTISQAAAGMMAMEDPLQQQVTRMNPQTQATLGKYGVRPQQRQSFNTSQNQRSYVSKSGDTTNIRNEHITNNRTEIRVTQPNVPVAQPVQQQVRQSDSTGKFKAWLSGMFAKQQNEAEIQRKEYRKKEWNLGRTTSRLMKRLETATTGISSKLDPKNMTSTLGGQLKWMLLIFGATMISKVWKPTMKFLANLEGGFRAVFGLPMNADLKQASQGTLSVIDKIGELIGIKKGEDTTLIGGIGRVFMEGINKLIDKLKFWFDDRANAIKSVEFPGLDIKMNTGLPYPLSGMVEGMVSGLTDTFGNIAQYLGDLITVAMGGSKGRVRAAANKINRQSKQTFTDTTGKQTSVGDSGLIRGGGRNYMRDSDFDSLTGTLKGNASSTQAMSRSLISLFNDKSRTAHTAEIGSGVEQLFNVAKRQGEVVIDPELLGYLGLTSSDVANLQRGKHLIQKNYRIIGVKPTTDAQRKEMGAYTGKAGFWAGGIGGTAAGAWGGAKLGAALGSFGGPIGTFVGGGIGAIGGALGGGLLGSAGGSSIDDMAKRWTTKGLYPIVVPADSQRRGDDGSLGIPKRMWVLTRSGADLVTAKFTQGMTDRDMSLTNAEFYEKLRKIEERRKRGHGVNGPLSQSIGNNDLRNYQQAYSAYQKEYYNRFESDDPNSYNAKHYGHYNTAMKSISDIGRSARYVVGSGFGAVGNFVTKERLSGKQVNSRNNYLIARLMKEGLTPEQAAGVAGNIMRESGFVTNSWGDNGTSVGIAQWHKERISKYNTQYGAQGHLADASFPEQVEYMIWEAKKMGVLNQLRGANGYAEAANIWERLFERSADYKANGNRLRIEYAAKALNSFSGVHGNFDSNDLEASGALEKQNGILGSWSGAVGGAIDKVSRVLKGQKEEPNVDKSFFDPTANMTKAQKEVFNKAVNRTSFDEALNKASWGSLGFTNDVTGTYYQSGNTRVYVRTDGGHNAHFGMSMDDIISVGNYDKNGHHTGKQPTNEEATLMAKSVISSVESLFESYEQKSKGNGYNDYLTVDGKPKGFRLGTYTDIQGFSPEARRDFGGQITFIVYPSKDRRRITMYGIPRAVACSTRFAGEGGKIRYYGPIIYHKGAKFRVWGTANATTDFQPLCLRYNVKLTPTANRDAKLLLMTLMDFGEITGKNGRFYKEDGTELTQTEIDTARKFGLIKLVGGHERVDTGYIKSLTTAKSDISTSRSRSFKNYLKNLSAEDKSSREKFYSKHKNDGLFWTKDGFLYGPNGYKWGTVDNKGKVTLYDNTSMEEQFINGGAKAAAEAREYRETSEAEKIGESLGFISRDRMAWFLQSSQATKKNYKNNQAYSVVNNMPLRLESGSTIYVPYHTFLDSNGNIVKYRVNIKEVASALRKYGFSYDADSIVKGTASHYMSNSLEAIQQKIIDKLNYDKAVSYKKNVDDKAPSSLKVEKATGRFAQGFRESNIDKNKIYKYAIENSVRILSIKGSSTNADGEGTFKVIMDDGQSFTITGKKTDLDSWMKQVNNVVAKHSKKQLDMALKTEFKRSGLERQYQEFAERANRGDLKYDIAYDNYVMTGAGDVFGVKGKDGKIKALNYGQVYKAALDYYNQSENRQDFYQRALGFKYDDKGNMYHEVSSGGVKYRVNIDTDADLNRLMERGLAGIKTGDIMKIGERGKIETLDPNSAENAKALQALANPLKNINKSTGFQAKLIAAFKNQMSEKLSDAAKVRVEQLNMQTETSRSSAKQLTYLESIALNIAKQEGTYTDLINKLGDIDAKFNEEKRSNNTFSMLAEKYGDRAGNFRVIKAGTRNGVIGLEQLRNLAKTRNNDGRIDENERKSATKRIFTGSDGQLHPIYLINEGNKTFYSFDNKNYSVLKDTGTLANYGAAQTQ